MRPIRPRDCTVVAGLDQGYQPLPIRHVAVEMPPHQGGGHARALETLWLPSPGELGALMLGHPVKIRLLTTQHPPIHVEVGDTETYE